MFIVVTVGSVFFGRKLGDTEVVAAASPSSTVTEYGSAEHPKVPGTLVLVGVFFITFVLYYFVNWKYLAEVWPLR
jgi:cytochrome c oxidase subunit I